MKDIKFDSNEKWMVAAEVTQGTLFMLSMTRYFTQEWPKHGLGNKIKNYISYFKDNNCLMYFKRSEFDAEADFLANKMIKKPDWALKVLGQVKKWSDKWIESAKKIEGATLSDLSDKELIKLYASCVKWQRLQHGIGCSVSWLADADGERVAKAIYKVVEAKLNEINSELEPAIAFSIVSTPSESSFASLEEKEFLNLAQKFWSKDEVKKILSEEAQVEKLKESHPEEYKLLYDHYKKWRWLPYGYRGPSYPFNYFVDRMTSLFKEGKSPALILKEQLKKDREFSKKQRSILELLDLDKNEEKLIELAQQIIFIKEYRKSALYYGVYCYELLFKEMGKRRGLSLDQMWAMNTWEVVPLFQSKNPPREELAARAGAEAITFVDRKNYLIFTGSQAREMYKRVPKENLIPDEEISEISGMCACPGEAKGEVKIIEVPSDIPKMNQGDILVSETTYPSLVPAMKKAGAIVTNAGGLTCHAAIVSRELRIPCVVGTKIANKIFKDGDRVEVNATKGIIRRVYEN